MPASAVIELYGRQYQNITGIMIVTPAPGPPLSSPYGDTMIRVTPTPTMTALIRRQRDKADQSS